MELSQLLVRTLWIFQLFASFPVFLFLGVSTYINIFRTYEDAYDFTMHFCTCLLAGAIVFIILVQRRIHRDRLSTVLALRFEAAKAACATTLWLWYFLDAALGPRRYYNCIYDREKRVRAAGVFVILLPVLFYPTVFWAYQTKRLTDRRDAAAYIYIEDRSQVSELTPLYRD